MPRIALILLLAVLVVSAVASLYFGAANIGFDTFKGWLTSDPSYISQIHILENLRLPRVLLAILVGFALAGSGAALQGLTRNPLVEPALIGVSSGAAFGAVSYLVFAAAWWPGLLQEARYLGLPLFAFAGALFTSWSCYRIAQFSGILNNTTLLLCGIAVNAIAASAVGIVLYLSNDQQLRTFIFWSLGSLSGASWQIFWLALPWVLLSCLALFYAAYKLNILSLGEREALHLGIDLARLKRYVILWSALGVGAAVAASGMIGFVGLMAPHLARHFTGADYRYMLPASCITGGILVLFADSISRTIVAPSELPIGILTSLIGAPFFLLLLQRQKT